MNALAGEVERAAGVIMKVEKDSESIGTVMQVIRDIAEQTNLLALNAAIEAARAGEQGRGFAVVADEVRTLASRTQASTEEIDQVIKTLQGATREAVQVMEASRDKARTGVDQASEAGKSLASISGAVDKITEMGTQIASAAEEQSAVVEEISRNVTSISEVASQTAEGSRQLAAASNELAGLSAELQALVGRFRVAD
jgi:methyl-accepting chemotaxis protein